MDYSCNERLSEKQLSSDPKPRTLRTDQDASYPDHSNLYPHGVNIPETNNNNNNNISRNNYGMANNADVYLPFAHINKTLESEVVKRENDLDSVLDNGGKEPRKIDIIAELLKCGAGKRDNIPQTPQPTPEPQVSDYDYIYNFIGFFRNLNVIKNHFIS